MTIVKTKSSKTNDTLELWEYFNKTADFKSNVYDKALLVEIQKELGFNEKANVRDEIQSHNTAPEQFLSVLLKLLKPFSLMMSDLLGMFEEAGAQSSDDNIQINFDFEDAKTNFGLDLYNFRVYHETLVKLVNYELQLEESNPWFDFIKPIKKVIPDKEYYCRSYDQFPNDIVQWLKEYDNKEINWPNYFPLPPQSGIKEIDVLISEIWQIPKKACELYNNCYQADLGRGGSLSEKRQNFQWVSEFYRAEHDCWLGLFVEYICYITNEIREINSFANDPTEFISEIEKRLKAFNDSLPIVSTESERIVKEWLDMLNLPIWKKRYALYSAWVSTQIISVFDKHNVRFNVVDGTISFSFGGSVIAYIEHDYIELALIAELRTPYAGVKGHGRTNSIQPDYSLCIYDSSNLKNPKNTVLVVECKQYKRPSKKNFNEAVEDYAGGRPLAQIILVNYTSIPKSFKTKLPKEVFERVPFFDALIPGDKSCDNFKEAVKKALPKKYKVVLSWGETPVDLDLISIITEPNGDRIKVDYSQYGDETHFPFVCLLNDDTTGNGHEVINALTFQTMKYDFCVHNFSGETTKGDYKVDISDNNVGRWVKNDVDLEHTNVWHALTVEHSKVCVVDEIVSYPNL